MIDAEILIDGLAVEEKLSLTERIWAELEKRPSEIQSPEWHGDILARRLRAFRNGETEFVDWAAAKRRLQRRYH